MSESNSAALTAAKILLTLPHAECGIVEGISEPSNARCAGDAPANGRYQQLHGEPRRREPAWTIHGGMFCAAGFHGGIRAVRESGIWKPSCADSAWTFREKHRHGVAPGHGLSAG